MKILVLQGGFSNEREVSLRSGKNVTYALKRSGHRVVTADPSDIGFNINVLSRDVDVIFPILHGAGGEDGSIQLELERLGKPFLGPGSEAAKLNFDKVKYKERLAEHGILTPNWEIVDCTTFAASSLARKSYVLKPISGGSSIDTFIVHNPQHQSINQNRLDDAFKAYGEMLLEELIEGQEITVGVLDIQALPVILIIPPGGEEFDYINKYNGKSQEITNPPMVATGIQEKAKNLAIKIHELTSCRHLSRTDMIIAENGAIYTLETNTIPGLTEQSLLPKAAAAGGIDMPTLVDRLVEMTIR